MVQFCIMPTPHEIFEALESRRLDLGLSQAEVGARAFGKADNSAFQALRRGSSPAADKLEALCRAVGWEFYFGPRRDSGRIEQVVLNEREYAHIPVHSAALAAGAGAENGDAEVIDHLAFRRDWLTRIGVAPSQAVLARAAGDSMVPTIQPGDLMLIDRAHRDLQVRARRPGDTRPAPIYALLDDGLARVKRIERPEPGLVMLLSDNPSYGPELVAGAAIERLDVIGKVMWWGHTNRE